MAVQTYARLDGARVLPDARLRRRLGIMPDQFTAQPDRSIPLASEGCNDMDAAYQFLVNPRVDPDSILVTRRPETVACLGGCRLPNRPTTPKRCP
ncbi:transposase DNA-binding-containing protein [Zavarzinella formosa]|uniref:transposase DNA-binding-containing protein n=1 Tax=Zavarzinella formosa TaxID=360055 RepID=UPI0002D281A4|nr:transposase DNA-binding-containing protein [Zavarzinella formosa]